MKRLRTKPTNCYLCGSESDLTRDHIPPRNLFPEPRPSNLITVSCCGQCHSTLTLDDEAFRVFAASLDKRSPAGTWIWKNKVVKSSFKRSPKLKENVKNSLITIRDEQTGSVQNALKFDQRRAENYLTRITKGLIRYYYPKIDYSESHFKIEHILPTKAVISTLGKLAYDERGDGVFRIWRGIVSDDCPESVWVYSFYDALLFMVEVRE